MSYVGFNAVCIVLNLFQYKDFRSGLRGGQMTTRTSSVLFVTLLAIATVCAQAQTAAGKPETSTPSASKVFPFGQMPARKSANGTESRSVPGFTLATGEAVGMHESVQPADSAPVALHAIHHSELILIQEGSMLFEHDGKQEKAGPGDMVYVADGTTHRLTNIGTGPAKYFVVQIGGDTKR
jgi:mannose-6-phosphate isomerase-like protein (cupin superfamily)